VTARTRSALWLLPAVLFLPPILAAQVAPTNVTAVESRGSVTVSWSGIRDKVTYRVLRAEDPKSTGEDLTSPLDPGVISFIDYRVITGTIYFYQVIAVYGDGSEGASLRVQYPAQVASPVIIATAPVPLEPLASPVVRSAPLPPPPAPTGVTVVGTPAQGTVKWLAMTGVTSFVVTRLPSTATTGQVTLPGYSLGWTDKGLLPSSPYTYTVDAVYPDGRKASTQVLFTTPHAINPGSLSASIPAVSQVKLTWPTVPGADYFIVLGPGSTNGGMKVSPMTSFTSYTVTNAPAGSQTWSVGSYYDPGPNLPGVPVGPYAVSTPISQFTKITTTVPAPPPTPVITARRTTFNPMTTGFMFVNDFKNSFMGPPFAVYTGGLCGGMSYAVLDYFNANRSPTNQTYRPANNTPVQQYLYARQVTSLMGNLDKWGELSLNPGGARSLEFFNWGLRERLVELRSFIDRGVPVPLGLKGPVGGIDHDHQVLAVGYDMGRYAGDLGSNVQDLKIFIWDPNHPGEIVTLVPRPSTLEFYELEHTADKWRTYFVDGKYQPMAPPVAVNPVYPADGLVRELLFEFLTGVDDMRGGADHVDVTVRLSNGTSQYYPNISVNGIWLSDYRETAQVILSVPVMGATIKMVEIVTNSTGGPGGDNWDLATVQITEVSGGFIRQLLRKPAGPYLFTGARTPFLVAIR